MFDYVVNDSNLFDFIDHAWSGGKDRLDSLRKHCAETGDWSAWDYLDEYVSEVFSSYDDAVTATETDINDFLWFESDDVLKDAGYLDEDYDWADGE